MNNRNGGVRWGPGVPPSRRRPQCLAPWSLTPVPWRRGSHSSSALLLVRTKKNMSAWFCELSRRRTQSRHCPMRRQGGWEGNKAGGQAGRQTRRASQPTGQPTGQGDTRNGSIHPWKKRMDWRPPRPYPARGRGGSLTNARVRRRYWPRGGSAQHGCLLWSPRKEGHSAGEGRRCFVRSTWEVLVGWMVMEIKCTRRASTRREVARWKATRSASELGRSEETVGARTEGRPAGLIRCESATLATSQVPVPGTVGTALYRADAARVKSPAGAGRVEGWRRQRSSVWRGWGWAATT